MEPATSLAELTEAQLIELLLQDSHWRERLLGIYGIPRGIQTFLEVQHGKLGVSGDVDILAVDPNFPSFATAIQVKRIKVQERSFDLHGKPNNLSKIIKLHEQTNRLVDLGFWQVFAFILVAVDSRSQNSGHYKFDGLTQNLRKIIEENIQITELAPRAGCIIFEITQPMDEPPLTTGTFSSHILRMPITIDQPDKITKWVMNNIQNKQIEE